ncbi:MAG: hypothetical protein ACXACU_17595, partial [Candidatus Hodarchaeales archaeon]
MKWIKKEFSLEEARKAGKGYISSDLKIFWNEDNSEGITRYISALIQDKSVKKSINEVTKLNDGRSLGLKENFKVNTTIGKKHAINLIT